MSINKNKDDYIMSFEEWQNEKYQQNYQQTPFYKQEYSNYQAQQKQNQNQEYKLPIKNYTKETIKEEHQKKRKTGPSEYQYTYYKNFDEEIHIKNQINQHLDHFQLKKNYENVTKEKIEEQKQYNIINLQLSKFDRDQNQWGHNLRTTYLENHNQKTIGLGQKIFKPPKTYLTPVLTGNEFKQFKTENHGRKPFQ